MADPVELNQTVTVYEFTNARTDNTTAIAPTLAASFDLDYDQTTVLSYGFNGGEFNFENGFMRQSFFVPNETGQKQYLIILGDDVENFVIQGYKDGGCKKGDEIDVTANVQRYETVLSDIFRYLLENNIQQYEHRNFDMEMFYNAAAELFDYAMTEEVTAQNRHSRHQIFFGTGTLEDAFSYTFTRDRVFYLTADITIPAGESVALNVEMIKAGSYDFYMKGGENIGVYGYDIMTNLDSGFTFDSMTTEILGIEDINIVRQNFDFDCENGIVDVPLDSDIPHYYIEINQAARN